MSSFLSNLIGRHTQADGNVKPRLRGRFEAEPRLAGPSLGDEPAGPYPAAAAPAEGPGPGALLPPAAPWPAIRQAGLPARGGPPADGPAPPHPAVGPPPRQSAPDGQPEASQVATEQNVNRLSTRIDASEPTGERPAQPAAPAPEPLAKPARAEPNAADWPGPPARPGGLLGEPARLPDFQQAGGRNPARPGAPAQLPPTIKVTIGRIDVRAVSPPPAARPSGGPKPLLSLEEYLARRNARGTQ
jgi:hypothetical protein